MKKIIILIIALGVFGCGTKKFDSVTYPLEIREIVHDCNYYFLDTTVTNNHKTVIKKLNSKNATFSKFSLKTRKYIEKSKATSALLVFIKVMIMSYSSSSNGLIWCELPAIYELNGEYWGDGSGIIVFDLYNLRRQK